MKKIHILSGAERGKPRNTEPSVMVIYPNPPLFLKDKLGNPIMVRRGRDAKTARAQRSKQYRKNST